MCATHTPQLSFRHSSGSGGGSGGGGSSSSQTMQRGTEKQDKWSEENATCKTWLKKKKLRKPSNNCNKLSMWKLALWTTSPGFLTVKLCSFAGQCLLCWTLDSMQEKKYTHVLPSLVEPCIQTKENHHSQLMKAPLRKKKKKKLN